MRRIDGTDLDVFPLCLGGNVFTWTADEAASLAVLDAYADAGGNFLDTADAYTAWVDGHLGGESEAVIGRWHTRRGNRDDIVIATKVGAKEDRKGLAPENIRLAAEESLQRLQTDRIDLYFVHFDDLEVPVEEILGALSELVDEGKVRYIAASNVGPERLAASFEASAANGLASYKVLQPAYNLVNRAYEGELRDICKRYGMSCVPYFGLAQGFLTGKYRPDDDGGNDSSPRAAAARAHFDNGGREILAALEGIVPTYGTSVAAVALAWLVAQPTVVSVISSARSTEQLAEILEFVDLELDPADLALLSNVGAVA